MEMRNERGGPRLHGQVVMGLFATQSGQIRVASNSNQWKMKGLENPSQCSHCSHFSPRDGEGAGGAAPVEPFQSLDGKARRRQAMGNGRSFSVFNRQSTIINRQLQTPPPPPCLEMRNWKIEKRKAQIQNRKGFRSRAAGSQTSKRDAPPPRLQHGGTTCLTCVTLDSHDPIV